MSIFGRRSAPSPSPRDAAVAWGVDAASKVALGTMASLGATFVCVYLAPGSQSWKTRTPQDIHDYLAAGYDVVFNWESDGTPAGGFNTGVDAAHRSVAQLLTYFNHCASCAADIGLQAPIYFNFADLQNPDHTQLAAALDGAASVVGRNRTGAYGGYDTIAWAFDNGLITWGWQTYAWSSGRRDPRAQLYQRLNGSTIDYDTAYAADFGQVPRPGGPPSPPLPTEDDEMFQDKYPLIGIDVDVWDVACGTRSFDGRRLFLGITLLAGEVNGWLDLQSDDGGMLPRQFFDLTVPSTNLSPRYVLEVPSGTTKARIGWDATKAQKACLTITGGK